MEHPETGAPIYAALAVPQGDVGSPAPWHQAAAGLRVAIPVLPNIAREAFESAFHEIGAMPVFIGGQDIPTAIERGATDLGVVLIDSPDNLLSILR